MIMKNKYDIIENKEVFKEESISILQDYIYSSRACYFIKLSSLEEEILLFYLNNSSVEYDFSSKYFFDKDIFVFLSRLIGVAYHYADGLIIDTSNPTSVNNNRIIYEKSDSDAELIDVSALDDLSKYNYVLLGKKVIYVTSSKKDIGIKNVNVIFVNVDDILSSNNWVEEYDLLKMKIMVYDFDVAFINIGILSTHLCYFISQDLHKIAIYKGDIDDKKS